MPDDEELRVLDLKLKQLKLDYDRYFLGTRPREPMLQRSEIDKLIAFYSSQAIKNTAQRFKFSSLCSRYQGLKRQWNEVLRQIDQGTYVRHRFKADLHERQRGGPPEPTDSSPPQGADPAGLFAAYRDARLACGQDVAGLTAAKLEQTLEKQREALKQRFGDAEFRFRVVVEDGKAKVKASRAS